MTFGGRLYGRNGNGRAGRARRIALGLTTPQLAAVAGVHVATISRLENGHRVKAYFRELILTALDRYQPRDLLTEAWVIIDRNSWTLTFAARLAGMPLSSFRQVMHGGKRSRIYPSTREKLQQFVDMWGGVSPEDAPNPPPKPAGATHPNAKLTPEQVVRIRTERHRSFRSLAKEFGMSVTAVKRARTGANWAAFTGAPAVEARRVG